MIENKELLNKAKEAMKNSYSPYSGFRVGAAVSDGTHIFTGCNIENASYGVTICAERCAIANAISAGITHFEKIAIVSSSGDYTMPCGVCRQTMLEFMEDGFIIVTNGKNIKEFKVKELLPGGFSADDMKGHKNGTEQLKKE